MSRYIDADALKAKKTYSHERHEYIVPVAEIDWLPTVDAVPVVRCGNCKHYKEGFCYNPNTYDDEKTCGNTAADWFCADGERKGGEHE